MEARSDLLARINSNVRLARIRAIKLARLLTRREYRAALRSGVAASVEHSRVPFRRDFRTVIDVGASRGQFALFATVSFPQARILSFEPLDEPLADLRRVTGVRVISCQTAIGAETGTVAINVSRQDDSSSVLGIGEQQQRIFPGTEAVERREIPITTLDEAVDLPLARPALLKIDVQGLELEVLKGASATLAEIDEALIECSFTELYEGQAMADEVIAHALGAGLRLVGIHGLHSTSSGGAVQADLHFRRDVN